MTLKERLELFNKGLSNIRDKFESALDIDQEMIDDVINTHIAWESIYPDLLKAVEKAQLYDKMIIASLIKSQKGDQK